MDTQYWMTVRCHLGKSLDCVAILITPLDQQVILMSKFQIGSNKFRYIYSPSIFQVNNATVYKCRRGTQEGSDNVCWLARGKDGHWVAREAHKDSADPVRQGKKIFRTKLPIHNIASPDDVEWQWYDEKHDTWEDFTFPFRTTQVLD